MAAESSGIPNEPRKITLDDLKRHFDNLAPATEEIQQTEDTSESPYIEAAAVLVFYEPAHIRPVGNASEGSVEERQSQIYRLISCSQSVIDPQITYNDSESRRFENIRYFLKDDIRKRVLHKLVAEGRVNDAIEANRDVIEACDNLLQEMLITCLTDKVPDPRTLNLERLRALDRIADWLVETSIILPDKKIVARQIQIGELLASFKHLTGKYVDGEFHETFRGRQNQLSTLRQYVGVAPPKGAMEYVNRTFDSLNPFKSNKKLPLLIHGLGGVGKSSLVAKFILEHVEAGQSDRFPFVYLDFDRPNLNANELDTLLVEAARQLAVQYADVPRISSHAMELYNRWKSKFLIITNVSRSKKISVKSVRKTHQEMEDSANIRASFKELVKILSEYHKRPFLWVMDTFEEVQYKGPVIVKQLYDFIVDLQAEYPTLRPVVAGRAPVSKVKVTEIPLADLDMQAAQGFLEKLGITDPDDALNIATKVGGNPLSLKLAADVVKAEGMEQFTKIKTSDKVLFFEKQYSTSRIQGILYDRILEHVKNPLVKKLAHPGLVLRFITAELILYVLSEPCELGITTMEQAEALFSELSKEVSLITQPDDKVLRHRPDLRKVMYNMIKQEKAEIAHTIHELAIKYFEPKDDIASRAEEVYHRLALSDTTTADRRWMEGIQNYLMSSIDELPPHSQTYLASRTGVDNVDAALWQNAAPEDKERMLTRRVVDYLDSGVPEEALKLIRQNSSGITTGILTMLEVKALVLLGRNDEANKIGENAIANAHTTGLSEQVIGQIRQFLQSESGAVPPPSSDSDENFRGSNRSYGDDMTEVPLA